MGQFFPSMFGGFSAGPSGPSFADYTNFAAAYATGYAPIVFVGDSKTLGQQAVDGVTNDGAYAVTTAKKVRDDLVAAGVAAIDGTFTGERNAAAGCTGGNFSLYDPRVTFGNRANWASNGGIFLDGCWNSGTAAETLVITPPETYDRVKVTYLKGSGAQFTLHQGATLLVTGDQTGGPSLVTQTVNVTRGTGALTMTVVSGTAFMPIINVWDSTAAKQVPIFQVGLSGRTSAGLIESASAWSPLNTYTAIGPKLAIVEIGANDANTGVATATFKSNLQTLITTLVGLSCDVQLVSTTRSGAPNASYDISAGYLTAIDELIATNSLPALIDAYTFSSPFSSGNYADGVHRTAAYNATIGGLISARLLA